MKVKFLKPTLNFNIFIYFDKIGLISVKKVKVGEFSVGGKIVPRMEIYELRKKEFLMILLSAQKLCFGRFDV